MPAKRKKNDEKYLARRKLILDGLEAEPWMLIDNWQLFAGIGNIARSLAIYDLLKSISHLPGHWAELGCWRGSNLVFMAKVARILDSQQHVWRRIVGFDWFKGLEGYEEAKDGKNSPSKGLYKGDPELINKVAELHGLDEDIELIKGDITYSVPGFIEECKDVRFSFVYVDCDLYLPCVTAIKSLWPKILKGGLLVFDEYNMQDWPGETAALHDALGEDVELRVVPNTRQPTAYVIK